MKRIEGRVAVVTGSAGGIGLATAIELARAGASVALADLAPDRLEAAAAEVAPHLVGDARATIHVCDVADRSSVQALVDGVLAEHGRVEIVVNNAGVSLEATLAESTWSDIDWLIGVNLMGVVHGCKLFLPALAAADEAHIVNLSSLFGLVGVPTQSIYCLTKYAVRGFSEALWEELAGTSIGVTVVHPGAVATDIMRSARYAEPGRSRERVIAFFERHGVSPSVLGERIVAAIREGEKRLVVPEQAAMADGAKRSDPVQGNAMVAAAMAQTIGLSGWEARVLPSEDGSDEGPTGP